MTERGRAVCATPWCQEAPRPGELLCERCLAHLQFSERTLAILARQLELLDSGASEARCRASYMDAVIDIDRTARALRLIGSSLLGSRRKP